MAYLTLILAIVAEVTATSFLRMSEGFTRLGPSLITVAGYAVAFFCLSLTLQHMQTGVAYAIWAGLGIVLITAVAWIFGGQELDAAAIAGMALIVAGVVVLNVFSKAGAH